MEVERILDPILLTLIINGCGMFLCIFAGILQARYGYKLYRDGAGQNPEMSHLDFRIFKIRTNSTGAVVMGLASVWVLAVIHLNPSIEKKGEDWRVFSMNIPNYTIEAKSVVVQAHYVKNYETLNEEALTSLFREAIQTSYGSKYDLPPEYILINSSPVEYDVGTLTASGTIGEVSTLISIETQDDDLRVDFVPRMDGDILVFEPTGIQKIIEVESSTKTND